MWNFKKSKLPRIYACTLVTLTMAVSISIALAGDHPGLTSSQTDVVKSEHLNAIASNIGESYDAKYDLDHNGIVDSSDIALIYEKVILTLGGDTNLDRVINTADLSVVSSNFGGTGKLWADGDFNGDGIVNIQDLSKLSSNYGKSQITHYSDFIAFWSFDDQSLSANISGSTARDASAVGGSASYMADTVRGNIISLNGTTQYIEAPNETQLNGSIVKQRTISLWFKADNASSANKQVLYEEGDETYGLNAYIKNEKLFIGMWNYRKVNNIPVTNWGNWIEIDPENKFNDNTWWDNKWHQLVVTIDAAGMATGSSNVPESVVDGVLSVYIDGELVVAGAQGIYLDGGTAGNERDQIILGASDGSNFDDTDENGDSSLGHYFDGLLDDIYVYNVVINEADIEQLYLNRVAYWPLDGHLYNMMADIGEGSTEFTSTEKSEAYLDRKYDINGSNIWAMKVDTANAGLRAVESITKQVTQYSKLNNKKINGYTVSAWVKLEAESDAAITSRRMVIYEQGDEDRGLNIYIYNGKIYAGGWNDDTNQVDWSGNWVEFDPTNDPDGMGPLLPIWPNWKWTDWHHVVFTLSGNDTVSSGAQKLYVDGVEIAQTANNTNGAAIWPHSESTPSSGGNIGIGQDVKGTRFNGSPAVEITDDTGSQWLKGSVDDVSIYRQPLNLNQIIELYTNKSPAVLTHLPFDQSGSDATVLNSVGSNVGSINHTTSPAEDQVYWQQDGREGHAFATVDQNANPWIELTTKPTIGVNDFSISFWVKFDELSDGAGIISHYDSSASLGYEVVLDKNGTNPDKYFFSIKISTGSGNSQVVLTSTEEIQVNKWYHVVFTINRDLGSLSRGRVYVNGKLDGINALRDGNNDPLPLYGINISPSTDMYVGKTASGNSMKGILDELRFYKGILSERTVANQFLDGNDTLFAAVVTKYNLDTDEDGLPDTFEDHFGLDDQVADFDPNGDVNQNGIIDQVELYYEYLAEVNDVPYVYDAHPLMGSTVGMPTAGESLHLTAFIANMPSDFDIEEDIVIKDRLGNVINDNVYITSNGIELRIDPTDLYSPIGGDDKSEYLSGINQTFTIIITKGSTDYEYTIGFTVDITIPIVLPDIPGGKQNLKTAQSINVSLTSFEAGIASPTSTKIYYSTDGSYPTQLYTGPVNVSSTSNLRYYGVDAAGNKGPMSQTVYFFDDTPLSPSTLSVTKNTGTSTTTLTDDTIDLSWEHVDGSSVDKYKIYRAYGPVDVQLIKESIAEGYPPPQYLLIGETANGTTKTFTDSSPAYADNLEVYYAVTAYKDDGESMGEISESISMDIDSGISLENETVDIRIQRALYWLEVNQHEAGYWEGQDRIVTTCRVLQTLIEHPIFVKKHRDLVNRALSYVYGHNAKSTDALARKIEILQKYGWDSRGAQMRLYNQALLNSSNQTIGWGGEYGLQPDALHSLLAARSFDDYTLQLPTILNYKSPVYNNLLRNSNSEYGWIPGNKSSVYVSLLAYQSPYFDNTVYSWIYDKKTVVTDGSTEYHTINGNLLDTAMSLISLKRNIDTNTPAWEPGKSIDYLLYNSNSGSTYQSKNGSWVNDAFMTALCLDAITQPNAMLICGDTSSLHSSDTKIKEQLEEMGFNVTLHDENDILPNNIVDYQIVIISGSTVDTDWHTQSPTANESSLEYISKLPVGIIVMQTTLYDDLHLTTNDTGSYSLSSITPNNSQHVLQAMKDSSNYQIYTSSQDIGWVDISNSISEKAEIEDVFYLTNISTKSVMFAYRKGKRMVNGKRANARRVGFYADNTADKLSDDGLDILESAIKWTSAQVAR